MGGGIAAGIVFGTKHGKAKKDPLCKWNSYRLPTVWRPESYHWGVAPQFQEPFNFNGAVTVQLTATDTAECIVLNQHELQIDSVRYAWQGEDFSDKDLPVTMVSEHDQFIVKLPHSARKGASVTLLIHYSGALGRNNAGLYLSTYEQDNETVPMIVTQFEATYARRAFPCFDEPAFKANFSISITGVPAGFTALANMPLASPPQNASDGTFRWDFQSSVRMSSYLVALAAGRLIHKSTTLPATADRGPVELGAWSRDGFQDQLGYSLAALADILPYYEERFQVPFPLPKQDMLAIPDFAAGAMENWGLITYRESAMLGNVSTSAQSQLQRIAVVVAHELAHQWFGDLVTMDWWSSLWLNEGFATFTEYRGADHFNPSFQMLNQFVPTDPQTALAVDANAASHALTRSEVTTPAQIEEMFDGISYSKGASVISMVASYLGDDTFNNGIANYLDEHAFGNASPDDLWAALGEAAGDDNLQANMQGWVNQVGYPVVSLSWNEAGTGLQATQQRFLRGAYSRSEAEEEGTLDTTWWVPFTYTVQGAADVQRAAFAGRTLDSDIPLAGGKWLKANADAAGYYRVNYPSSVWEAQLQYLTSNPGAATQLNANDRSNLLNDLTAIVMSGTPGAMGTDAGVNATLLLRFAAAWRFEDSWTAWRPGVSLFASLTSLLHGDEAGGPTGADGQCLQAAHNYAADTLTAITAAVGWEVAPGSGPEAPIRTLLRTLVLQAAVDHGVPSAVSEALARYDAYMAGNTSVLTADTRAVAFSAAVANKPGREAWDAMKALYIANPNDATLRKQASYAMADAQDSGLLQATLDFALSDDVRAQDSVSIVTAVAGNPGGRQLAWQFFKDNFQTFMDRYGQGGFAISNLVNGVASHFVTAPMATAVQERFDAFPVPAAEIEVEEALEAINAHVAFLDASKDQLCQWLTAHHS